MGSMTPKSCDSCARCKIFGYNPRKYVNTISYWCELKHKHVTPQSPCARWTQGQPWREARRNVPKGR